MVNKCLNLSNGQRPLNFTVALLIIYSPVCHLQGHVMSYYLIPLLISTCTTIHSLSINNQLKTFKSSQIVPITSHHIISYHIT